MRRQAVRPRSASIQSTAAAAWSRQVSKVGHGGVVGPDQQPDLGAAEDHPLGAVGHQVGHHPAVALPRLRPYDVAHQLVVDDPVHLGPAGRRRARPPRARAAPAGRRRTSSSIVNAVASSPTRRQPVRRARPRRWRRRCAAPRSPTPPRPRRRPCAWCWSPAGAPRRRPPPARRAASPRISAGRRPSRPRAAAAAISSKSTLWSTSRAEWSPPSRSATPALSSR